MLGTLIYTTLDIGLNVILWTSKTAINGVCYAYNYITTEKNDSNQDIELQQISNESISSEEFSLMRSKIEEQTQMILELKSAVQSKQD